MKREERYDSLYQFYSQEYNLDWKMLKAQDKAESALNPDAVSGVGAMGLAQFMPATWNLDIVPKIRRYYEKYNGRKYKINIHRYDPEDSILGQCIYMSYLIKRFQNMNLAFAAYNYGPGAVARVIRHAGTDVYNEIKNKLPQETQNYVRMVNKYYTEVK